MNDYTSMTKRYSIITLGFIGVTLALAFTGFYSLFFRGLTFGALFSLVMLISTYFQVKRTGNSIQTGKYKAVFGTVSRILLVIVAILIATEYPANFHLVGVIIGLMFTNILILISPLFTVKRAVKEQ